MLEWFEAGGFGSEGPGWSMWRVNHLGLVAWALGQNLDQFPPRGEWLGGVEPEGFFGR